MGRRVTMALLFLLTLAGLAIGNSYYNGGSYPPSSSFGNSASMRNEFTQITNGFNLLPTLGGNANTAVVVNGAANGLTTTPGTLTLTGNLNLGSNLTLSGGFATTLTTTGVTSITLPISGTLATTGGNLGASTLAGGTLTGTTTNSGTISGGTISGATLSGTTTNSGTLSGGTISGATFSGSANTVTNISLTSSVTGVLPIANGGTNLSTTPTNGQLLIGNGSGYTLAGLSSSGTGTSITSGPGSAIVVAEGFSTGDVKLSMKSTADTGWVLMNDGTIGNSGCSTRSNADTQALYLLLWNNLTDQWAPVSTGRGASAAADFAANKCIRLPRATGRALAGLGTPTVTESISGAASGNALTVASNNTTWITGMQVTVSGSGYTGLTNGTWYIVRASSTTVQFATTLANAQNGTVATISGTSSATLTWTGTTRAIGETGGEEAHAMSSTELLAHTHANGFAAYSTAAAGGSPSLGSASNTTSTGGNAAMNILQPSLFLTVMIKL